MHRLFRLFFLLIFLFAPASVKASDCQIVYGGGEIACDKPTTSPTPNAQTINPPETKGGLPVHPPSNVQTTPATGPEAFGLIALVPAAGLGFWLRRQR